MELCGRASGPEDVSLFREIGKTAGMDLFAGGALGKLSHGERRAVLALAAQRWVHHWVNQMINNPAVSDPLGSVQAGTQAWAKSLREGHAKRDWLVGARELLSQHPSLGDVDPPEPPSIARQMWPFIWSAFQATILMKIIILYFGQHAALYPDENYGWYLGLAVAFSFSSLLYFAWRRGRKDSDTDFAKDSGLESESR